MAMNPTVLLPKLHLKRCVLDLEKLHVPKKLRALAKGYEFSVDGDFDGVIKGMKQQHGSSCWLYPKLVELLRTIRNEVCAFISPQTGLRPCYVVLGAYG